MEVFRAGGDCGHFEYHATVGANDGFFVFRFSADFRKVAAASYGLHNRKHYRHRFCTYSLTLRVYGAAVRAFINVADFFAVSAKTFRLVAAKVAYDLDCPFIFFIVPFFHNSSLTYK